MNIKDFGFYYDLACDNTSGTPARVTAVHKGRFGIVSDFGEGYASLKSKEYYYEGEVFPTVGDFVLIDYVENGDSRIIKTIKRKTYFSRRDPDKGRGEQVIAANFDYVFIMQSLNNDFNPKRIERYLTAARQSGAEPVIILTKADLTDDYLPYILEISRVAEDVETHIVSAKTGFGLDKLSKFMQKGNTLVFLGSSGVGKSSLVNTLAGGEIMDVNGIREDDSKGRHTTTHRELIMLKNGVMIIDTPGMRELGMWDVTEGLSEAFEDVEKFIGKCRFRDCKHENEPGCAVRKAIENGELDLVRFESYKKLKSEAKYRKGCTDYRKQKQQWEKALRISDKKKERF
ncbi:MAG: ribosome small subunit-dependent GTPase A [Ruminococcaceae bacterium]|nr:ribosome small subunit-dependent GTPase A [Oscillospiraceae bacterium]